MKKFFTITGLLLLFLITNQVFSQVQQADDPNRDQIPYYLREVPPANYDAPVSSVITINNWDNFNLGIDFAENNMATNLKQPTWFFSAYNTNGTHHTEDGHDWFINNPSFGVSVAGDPVVVYDSLGNLFYENMYGNIAGCKVVVSTTNGASWGAPVTAIAGVDKNWITADQTAGPYANYVYTTMTANSGGNFYRSIDHGATFSSTFTPSNQSLPGMMVCVGPNNDIQGGSVYVVTNSGNSFTPSYNFYVSHDGGTTFTPKSNQQWVSTVGTQVGGRNAVLNMRTRPYPMIASDNSYGPNRGKFYCVYAANDPPGNGNKPNVYCRTSTDQGATWSAAVQINDDPGSQANHQWHPGIWCDKETGKLYVMWLDTRDTPTSDSAFVYASYSTDGGATFVTNQRISNKKMKINCPTCGGGGTPAYQGDYHGLASNKKVAMLGWADFRVGSFMSMSGYFPDYAMAIDHASDTLYSPADNATFQVSIPEVKLYTDTVILSGTVNPVPTTGTIAFEYPDGNTITTYPNAKAVKLVLSGNVPTGNYQVSFIAKGPNGTPIHKRIATVRVLPGSGFVATASATPGSICQGQTSQLNVVITGGTAPFTYQWTPSTGLSDPTIANPIATPDVTTTYSVLVTDAASVTASSNASITVNMGPVTPGPINGLQLVCTGLTTPYSVDEIPGATSYSWTPPPGDTVLTGQNTANVTIQFRTATSGNVSVIAVNNCGPSAASILAIKVDQHPNPLNPISGPSALCKNTETKFWTSMTDEPETYSWFIVPPEAGQITSGDGTDTIHVTWGQVPGTVGTYAYNECGESDSIFKEVTVTAIPDPAGTISGMDTVCQGEGNYQYTIPVITGATSYTWNIPVGATISAGQGTNQITLTFSSTAQPGVLSVKGLNECGEGTESVKAIAVKNCSGIEENNLNASVQIYPNPVSNELTLSINGKENKLTLTISDVTGIVKHVEELKNIPGNYKKKIDFSNYAKGMYIFKLSNSERVYSTKVIVQ